MGKAGFLEPMKAKLVERPPSGDWIYEIKHDGFRVLAVKNGKDVQLLSRNNKELGGKFPEVAAAVAKLKSKDLIIDGEVVAVEPNGKSSFQLLQAYDVGDARPPIVFYAFDLLRHDGKEFFRESLTERKARLEKLIEKAPPPIRFSDSLTGDVANLLEQARKLGLEGLIGKKADSQYEVGRRSGNWIKLKITLEQEMVIGGYTAPQGSRSFFGSILVGFYEGEQLICAGKVGTGFNEKSLKSLYREMQSMKVEICPFANLPEKKGSRYSPGITVAEMRRCMWVEPKLVCQIKYTEWTRDGKLRHPVFLGLRDDKAPSEVVREVF